MNYTEKRRSLKTIYKILIILETFSLVFEHQLQVGYLYFNY